MVGNIGQPVGRLAAAFYKYRILILPKIGSFEPGSPFFIIGQVLFSKSLDGFFDGTVVIEVVLVKKGVHFNIHAPKGLLNIIEDQVFGFFLEGGHILGICQAVTVFLYQFPGNILDILSFITSLREFGLLAKCLQVSCFYTFPKHPHLTSGIIEVVFAVYVSAGPLKEPGNSVAQYRVAAMTDR